MKFKRLITSIIVGPVLTFLLWLLLAPKSNCAADGTCTDYVFFGPFILGSILAIIVIYIILTLVSKNKRSE
ncbi:hypothetical protein CL622_05570 [archaeon]|nr:hypothetical protein [archaeon]